MLIDGIPSHKHLFLTLEVKSENPRLRHLLMAFPLINVLSGF